MSGQYFVASIHREENVDNPIKLNKLMALLGSIIHEYGFPMIFSCHPRTKKQIDKHLKHQLPKELMFVAPLGLADYCFLQKHAACVLSDSGTITEEASLLSFPAITFRQAHERPEGMDVGTVVMVGEDKAKVLEAIDFKMTQFEEEPTEIPIDYLPSDVSYKVVNTILSYTDYVNRKVWGK